MARFTRSAVLSLGLSLAPALLACGGENASSSGGAVSPTSGESNGKSLAGASASDFSARDTQGKTVRLSEYLGKKAILINFWATWCEPCIAEFPHLRRLQDSLKDDLVILGVSMDGPESIANVPAFASRNQLNFPVLLDEDSHVAAIYNPKKSAPLSILIDKKGRITAIREGYNPGDEEFLKKDIAKMLDEKVSSK